MVHDFNQLDLERQYSYADYLTWKFSEVVELIRGRIHRMSPAPNLEHQRVVSRLHGMIFHHIEGGGCEVFTAPFDVRLPLPQKQIRDDKIDTVVQPDLCVVCDPGKLDMRGCLGAPDWVIEILSPATSRKDFTDKYEVYEHAGVGEYWIIHPHEQTLWVYVRDAAGQFQGQQRPYLRGDRVPSHTFPGWQVDLDRVFPEAD
ncbi:MAG: Uma2 family endonuclease [Bacteroidetes bacterium]|nr:MAG: Uma2 family endonuclease [Bacteroidota bacterium]